MVNSPASVFECFQQISFFKTENNNNKGLSVLATWDKTYNKKHKALFDAHSEHISIVPLGKTFNADIPTSGAVDVCAIETGIALLRPLKVTLRQYSHYGDKHLSVVVYQPDYRLHDVSCLTPNQNCCTEH